MQKWTSGIRKMRGITRLAEGLLAYQKRLFSMKSLRTDVTMNVFPLTHHACGYLQSTMYSRCWQIMHNVIYFVPNTYSTAKEQTFVALKRKKLRYKRKCRFSYEVRHLKYLFKWGRRRDVLRTNGFLWESLCRMPRSNGLPRNTDHLEKQLWVGTLWSRKL